MSQPVQYRSKSGKEASGFVSLPPGDEKKPGLIVIQEWWGINGHIKDISARFANEGFVVLSPDLYHGRVTASGDEAGKWMTELSFVDAVDEIEGAIELLKAHDRCNGQIAVTGFCMGGALSFACASAIANLRAVVPFYGTPDTSKWDITKTTAPILAHFASQDQWATPSKAEAIKASLDKLGKPMELCVYDADHAFMRDTDPSAYNADAAKLAWAKTIAFLKQHTQ